MQITVNWSPEVSRRFPQLAICISMIRGVQVERENEKIKKLRKEVQEEVRTKFDAETLKDNPAVRAYRDLYWKLDIDPTKTRPSGESLLRRALHGSELPIISTVVDAYNLASMKTTIPTSGFDSDRLNPPFQVRFAKDNETFTGIGNKTPTSLTTKMLVLADEKQTLCIYPYHDCDNTKITLETRNVAIVGYGAPGIGVTQLEKAVETTLSFIKQVSEGETEAIQVFQSSSV